MRIVTRPKQRAVIARELMMVSRAAHVLQRTGLAMAGAMAGTFVAAQLAKGHVAVFGTLIFIATTIVIGAAGFYLGIDVPKPVMRGTGRIDAVELMSAGGIFLAALAALVSVYGIVFDEIPPRAWEFVIGSWWFGGGVMLATAGLVGRQRPAQKAAALSAGPIRDQRLRR
ncbi:MULTISPECIES: hypothetical protein [Bradyrhizobium]|uniref:Uncharacterized protein n=1 Tax=Bradyrhizobium brasilense TaxID=1419277 RepID=A0A1G6NQ62_9BRAD|nr:MULTISPECIES: hypothetical protein [Bradyrhizobium]MCA6099799.1 hypothetical protein [Bradyrhizobium australafricanum]MCC8971261.1 hypothetical protein [Bradyrhizobium brasilense]SDC69879.1 hypothetical protein SAMN05216337_1004205 [Bradyrhizobium brasilense]